MDEEKKAQIRHYRRNIENGGWALVGYSAWAVLKLLITTMWGSQTFLEYIQVDPTQIEGFEAYFYIVLVFMIMNLSFLYVYMGMSAVKFARNKKKSLVFLFWVGLTLLLTLVGLPSYVLSPENYKALDTFLAALLVDITLCFILADVLFSSFRCLWLNKKYGKKIVREA